MPITPFLAGQAFDPEAIDNMSAAFVAACDALQLKVGDDPATRFVAEKVIEFAQRGMLCKFSNPFKPTACAGLRAADETVERLRGGNV